MAAVENAKQREATWPDGGSIEIGAAGSQVKPKVPAGVSVVAVTPRDPLPELPAHRAPSGAEQPVSSHALQLDAQGGPTGNGTAAGGSHHTLHAGQAQPAPGKAVAAAPVALPAGTPAEAVVSLIDEALKQPDYLKALNDAYAKAKAIPDGQRRMQANPTFHVAVVATAKTATRELTDINATSMKGLVFPQARSDAAVENLRQTLEQLDPAFAGLVADEAVPLFQHFYQLYRNMPNGAAFGREGVTALVWLSDRIAGTAEGKKAIAGFVTLNAWDPAAVRDAMAHGASNAYAIAYARYAEAESKDPSFVLRALEEVSLPETRVALQGAAANDVRVFAENDAEMAWVAQNVCAPLGFEPLPSAKGRPSSLAQMGMEDGYLASKSWEEKVHSENLRTQAADDGVKLLKHVLALIKIARGAGLAPAMQEQLIALANDQSSCLAIQMALQKYPELLQGDGLKDVVELVEALRNHQPSTWGDGSSSRFALTAGDIGKLGFLAIQISDGAAKAFVADKFEYLPLYDEFGMTEPKATQAITKALEELRNSYFARLIGVKKADLDKAISATETFNTLASRARGIYEIYFGWLEAKQAIRVVMLNRISVFAPRLSEFADELFIRSVPERAFLSPAAIAAGLSEVKLLRQQNHDGSVAGRYGVHNAEFDEALDLLESAFNEVLEKAKHASLTAEDVAVMDSLKAEAARLNGELGKIEAFGPSSFPGKAMRLLGAAATVLWASSEFKAFIDRPDPVTGLKTAAVIVLAGQQVSEFLVSQGLAGPTSAVGLYASASWGGKPIGDFGLMLGVDVNMKIGGVLLEHVLLRGYAVFEAFDAVRSGFGILGGPQDTGAAVVSGISAAGIAMGGWAGAAVVAVAAGGKSVYKGVKDAHKYEAASEICLKAAGFNDVAAAKLSRQGVYLSAVTGTGQMGFLAEYAHYRGMTMVALRDWINTLTPEQVEALSNEVLHALNEGVSDPSRHRQQWVGAGLQDKSPVAKASPEEAAKRWQTIEMSLFERALVRDKVLAADKVKPPSFEPVYK